jgi:hypothetical protein
MSFGAEPSGMSLFKREKSVAQYFNLSLKFRETNVDSNLCMLLYTSRQIQKFWLPAFLQETLFGVKQRDMADLPISSDTLVDLTCLFMLRTRTGAASTTMT